MIRACVSWVRLLTLEVECLEASPFGGPSSRLRLFISKRLYGSIFCIRRLRNIQPTLFCISGSASWLLRGDPFSPNAVHALENLCFCLPGRLFTLAIALYLRESD